MHVSLVANRLNLTKGGSDLSLDLLARHLTSRGHTVRVITVNTTAPNELGGSVPYEVDPHPLGEDASRPALARTLYQLFDDTAAETDLFHVFNPPFITIGGLYRRRGGSTPVVGRLNNYTIFCTNPSLMDGECHESCSVADKFRHDPRDLPARVARSPTYLTRSTVEPWLINNVDRLFAISPAIRDIYGMNGLDADTIDVIPNFYDPDFAAADTTEDGELALPHRTDDQLSVLYVGRLIETKGADVLVDAVARTDREDIVLDIVGDGGMRDALEEQVAAADVGDRIRFHGWVDHGDLPAYYRDASVFVHPGRWPEPFGRTIIEAMQCGCVPVVTDVGAPPWIADDAGIVVPKDDPNSLASTLEDLAADPARRDSLATMAGERVERFAPERVLDQIEDTYVDVGADVASS